MSLRVLSSALLTLILTMNQVQAEESCKKLENSPNTQEVLLSIVGKEMVEVKAKLEKVRREAIAVKDVLIDQVKNYSTKDFVYKIALPASGIALGTIITAKGGARFYKMSTKGGRAWLALPLATAQVSAGAAVFGATTVYVTREQLKIWDEKLKKAEQEYENELNRLKGMEATLKTLLSKNLNCVPSEAVVSTEKNSRTPVNESASISVNTTTTDH